MNPYQFQNPEIRHAAFGLAHALENFDKVATAALEACEKRIAALETKGGNHETQVATAADLVSTGAQHLSDVAPYTSGLSGRV